MSAIERLRELWEAERDEALGRELATMMLRLGDPLAAARILVELGDDDFHYATMHRAPETLTQISYTMRPVERIWHASTGIPVRWSKSDGVEWWRLWIADVIEAALSPALFDTGHGIPRELLRAPDIIRKEALSGQDSVSPEAEAMIDLADRTEFQIRNIRDAGGATTKDDEKKIAALGRLMRAIEIGLTPGDDFWVGDFDGLLYSVAAARATLGGSWTDDGHLEQSQWVYDSTREMMLTRLMDIMTGRVDPRVEKTSTLCFLPLPPDADETTTKSAMVSRGPCIRFETTINAIRMMDRRPVPVRTHVADRIASEFDGETWKGRRVTWDLSETYATVLVPVELVTTMEGNLWNPEHAAGLMQYIREGDAILKPPAARLYRIDQWEYDTTMRYHEDGELAYQQGMTEPWDEDEIGEFYVQLVDGNHRYLAAMLSGETEIPVLVGQNYRDDVKPDEWLQRR